MKWVPVVKVACACGKSTCAKCVHVEYADGVVSDTLWYTREDGREEMMYLPTGYALCRLVPDGEDERIVSLERACQRAREALSELLGADYDVAGDIAMLDAALGLKGGE